MKFKIDIPPKYQAQVRGRSAFRYFLGLFSRNCRGLIYFLRCRRARVHKATVGHSVVLSAAVAKAANHNLECGNDCSISGRLDFRQKIRIGDHVNIGEGSLVIREQHDVDSDDFRRTGKPLEIGSYVWIAPHSIILPRCTRIGRGAVIGAGAVVAGDVPDMAVMGGNPARILRNRKCVNDNMVVSSLRSGDLRYYREARKP